MDETVSVMKRLWTEPDPVDHDGQFFKVQQGAVRPFAHQKPHPPFYLGGISDAAMEVCGKYADVYLSWLDTKEQIAGLFDKAREAAARHGREETLEFGVRGQVIVRETEEEAWAAANHIIEHTPENLKASITKMWTQSQANQRMQQLSAAEGFRVGRHLWSGLTVARPGTGVAIVGNPEQVASTRTAVRTALIWSHSFARPLLAAGAYSAAFCICVSVFHKTGTGNRQGESRCNGAVAHEIERLALPMLKSVSKASLKVLWHGCPRAVYRWRTGALWAAGIYAQEGLFIELHF